MYNAETTWQMSNRRYYGLLLLIVVIGMLFQLYHLHLTIGSDDQRWIITARELGQERSGDIHPVYYGRILWRVALAAWGCLFAGASLENSAVLTILLSAASVFLVAQAARVAFGPQAGLLAAAVYAGHPITILCNPWSLPDALAIVLLTAYVFFFLKYLREGAWSYLAAAGFLTGLSFAAKEYYVLAAFPMCLCILMQPKGVRGKLGALVVLSASALLGLSVNLALHVWDSGQPFAHFARCTDYGERIVARSGSEDSGLQVLLRLGFERLEYLDWLFCSVGFVSGFLALWGLLWLLFRARERMEYLWLLVSVVVFAAFLAVMPASLRPFRFVEMQPRYLTILLPMLAIATGDALAVTLTSLRVRAVNRPLGLSLLLALASNVGVPNDLSGNLLPRARTQVYVGLRQVVRSAASVGITELALPPGYKTGVPDWYYAQGLKIGFYESSNAASAAALVGYLKADRGRAVFVPRERIKLLTHLLRCGEYNAAVEEEKADRIVAEALRAHGAIAQPVRAPDTVFMEWLAWFGLVSSQQDLVGWVYRFPVPADATRESTPPGR